MNRYCRAVVPLICLCLICITFSASADNTAAVNYLRIGITGYRNVSEITINEANITVGFITNDTYTKSAYLQSANGAFSASKTNLYYVRASGVYPDFSQAQTAAAGFGAPAVPALIADYTFAVYIGGFASESEAAAAAGADMTVIAPSARRTAVYTGGNIILIFDNPENNAVFLSDTDSISIGGSGYRGYLEIYPADSGVTAVNVIDVEEYLYSVVPSEMPSHWHTEALKAQAVAARSYAATRLDAHISAGFNFCDTVHCQLYPGIKAEEEETQIAVALTKGLIAYYDGEPINAVYSASSGGATANSESVWSEAVPYLRGVPDPFETTGHKWERTIPLSVLTTLAAENGHNIGNVTSLEITKRSPQGRVDAMVVIGTAGRVTLENENVRTFFSGAARGSLQSRMFGFNADFAPPVAPLPPPNPDAASGIYLNNEIKTPEPLRYVYTEGASGVGMSDINDLFVFLTPGLPPARLSDTSRILGGFLTSRAETQAPVPEELPENYIITPSQGNLGPDIISGDPIIITGQGFGHGVGMSQHGARGMAENGYSFIEIIEHYYQGAKVY